METLLQRIETVFGPRLVVAFIVIAGAYFVVLSLGRLLEALREGRGGRRQLEALKLSYEVAKLQHEIAALREQHSLATSPTDDLLAHQSARIIKTSVRDDLVSEVRHAAETRMTAIFRRSRVVAHCSYLVAQLVLRGWFFGLLCYVLFVATFDSPTVSLTHWDNVIIMSIPMLLACHLTHWVTRAYQRAGFRDVLSLWPYVVATAGASVLVFLENVPVF